MVRRSVSGWSVLTIAMLFATMSASDRANAAGLSLVVDSTTKTLWFDGSDSGTLGLNRVGPGFVVGRVNWGTKFSEDSSLDTRTTINATLIPDADPPGAFGHYIAFRQSDLGLYIEGIAFYSSFPGTPSWTFSGMGSSAAISYAGLSSAFQNRLESLATSNAQFNVSQGSGNSLKMSLFSSGGSGGSGSGGSGGGGSGGSGGSGGGGTGGGEVPEPTSMAIFALGALGFAYRARRKSKA